MLHQEFEPPKELRDTIRCFWYNKREAEQQPNFEVVPDGYAEIIFHFDHLYSLLPSGDLQALPSPFMMGLLNTPAHFYTENSLEIIGIRCYPWMVFDLLGLPSDRNGVHIFEHPIAKLQPKLYKSIKAGNITEAIKEVTQYFLDLQSQITVNSMLVKAGTAMSKAKGTLPVSRVAEATHATVRTLERKFKQSSGHTIKDVSGLMRFEQVRNYLWHTPEVNLAGLAHEFGYTDQSHLSREFKRYSNTTPAAFARKAKKGKLIFGNNFVAFIQA